MDAPKTVTMEALQYHTVDGIAHQPGEVYEAPAVDPFTGHNFPETLELLQYARRVEASAPKTDATSLVMTTDDTASPPPAKAKTKK